LPFWNGKIFSSILRSVCTIDKDRAKSIKWLKANLKESMFTVGYCILVDQRNSVKLDCHKYLKGDDEGKLLLDLR